VAEIAWCEGVDRLRQGVTLVGHAASFIVAAARVRLIGALGQFERDLIRERTRAGLAPAVARDRKGGRKPVVTEDKLRRAKALVDQGLTVREAAARVKVGKTALYAALDVKAPGEAATPG
jgi:DNA invertase Pin-like site-specific DNA recombinase